MSPSLQAELDRTLAGVLDEMRLAVAQLNETLDAERDAIRGPDVSALDQAGARKQILMQQLEQLDAERVQLLRHAPDADALAPAWQAVLRSLQTCRELNQRNGSVVGQRLGEVRRALSILTGHSADTGVYGRSGTLHTPPRSKTLAEA
jgi:flagella synthesis protein FlgN